MGRWFVNNQVGIIHPILISLLVGVLVCLGLAMIWVILFAPHFGKQFAMPIKPVACEIIASPAQSAITVVNPANIEKCYKVEDVLALNKALKMTDTLSLFGLLLAIFALITPVLSYVTLKKEKQYLENSLKKSMKESTAELKKTMALSINQFPKLLSSIEAFKMRYQIDEPRGSYRCSTEAYEIIFRLLPLLDSNTSTNQAFDDIDTYITEEAVLDNKPHIQALKQALRQIYDATYLGSDTCKTELSRFLQKTLKISLKDFLNDTALSDIH